MEITRFTIVFAIGLAGCAQSTATAPYHLHCFSNTDRGKYFATINEGERRAALSYPSDMVSICRGKKSCAFPIQRAHRDDFWRYDGTIDVKRFVFEWDSSTKRLTVYDWDSGTGNSPTLSFTGFCHESQIDPVRSTMDGVISYWGT